VYKLLLITENLKYTTQTHVLTVLVQQLARLQQLARGQQLARVQIYSDKRHQLN
jgi:hypothetical protein